MVYIKFKNRQSNCEESTSWEAVEGADVYMNVFNLWKLIVIHVLFVVPLCICTILKNLQGVGGERRDTHTHWTPWRDRFIYLLSASWVVPDRWENSTKFTSEQSFFPSCDFLISLTLMDLGTLQPLSVDFLYPKHHQGQMLIRHCFLRINLNGCFISPWAAVF